MKRFRAWCRREGDLNTWPRKIRQVLRTLACEHSWSITSKGLVSKFIARRMTGHYVGETAIKVIDELYCYACQETVAVTCGNHFTTINKEEKGRHPAIVLATKPGQNWMD